MVMNGGWFIFAIPTLFIYIYICILVGGFNHSEKYEFVIWDDDIPNHHGKIKHESHVPNHQPVAPSSLASKIPSPSQSSPRGLPPEGPDRLIMTKRKLQAMGILFRDTLWKNLT